MQEANESYENIELTPVYLGKESTQKPDDEDRLSFTPGDCIEPPLNLHLLAKLSSNGTRKAIIEALARNTVGLGYDFMPPDDVTPTEPEDEPSDDETQTVDPHLAEAQQCRKAIEAAARRDMALDRPSLKALMFAVITDREETGTGYLEVSRDRRTGKIDGLYHAPAARVRRLRDRTGYKLLPRDLDESGAIAFLNFGDKVKYDDNGQPTNQLATGTWGTNELLSFRIYTSETRDYGLPRDVSLATDYAGDKLAAESNVSFFDASGTPPTIIFVQGDEDRTGGKTTFKVPQETVTRIAQTLKSDAGHRHRVAVIPVPPGTATNSIKLGETTDRDMGFTEFRKDNRDRALSSFRVQPIFIGASGDGRYDAEVQRAITLEQLFDPEQTEIEDRLNATVVNDLGFPDQRLKWKRLAVENDAARREAAERAAEVGAITHREFREAHGLPPYTGKNAGKNDELIDPKTVAAGQPKGAGARVNDAQDQRGLQPDTGARTSRDKADGQQRPITAVA
jgi:capsid portal protein